MSGGEAYDPHICSQGECCLRRRDNESGGLVDGRGSPFVWLNATIDKQSAFDSPVKDDRK